MNVETAKGNGRRLLKTGNQSIMDNQGSGLGRTVEQGSGDKARYKKLCTIVKEHWKYCNQQKIEINNYLRSVNGFEIESKHANNDKVFLEQIIAMIKNIGQFALSYCQESQEIHKSRISNACYNLIFFIKRKCRTLSEIATMVAEMRAEHELETEPKKRELLYTIFAHGVRDSDLNARYHRTLENIRILQEFQKVFFPYIIRSFGPSLELGKLVLSWKEEKQAIDLFKVASSCYEENSPEYITIIKAIKDVVDAYKRSLLPDKGMSEVLLEYYNMLEKIIFDNGEDTDIDYEIVFSSDEESGEGNITLEKKEQPPKLSRTSSCYNWDQLCGKQDVRQ